jgi:hypothetical protein
MRQRIVGPVSMITVGALFLLQEFTRWDFHETWPLLLIAIGAAMFVQRSSANNPSFPPAGAPAAVPQTDSDKVNHG